MLTTTTRRRPRARQFGITLVESTVVTAITAVLLGVAAPAFHRTIEQRHMVGMAAQFETDVAYARSEAQARSQPVRLSFAPHPAGSCYVVHTGASGDCRCDATGHAACSGTGAALRAVFVPAGAAVTLSSNARSMLFDARRQTVTPAASVTFAGRSGSSLRQVVNIMGRVRSCSPLGTMPGFRPC